MPKFVYVARNKDGSKVRGEQEATSRDELVARLQAKGYVISSISESAAEKGVSRTAKTTLKARGKHSGISSSDFVLFARQMATMLNAGVSILKSLEIIQKQTESRRLERVIGEVIADMELSLIHI